MSEGYHERNRRAWATQHPMYDRLPEYAALLALGQPLDAAYAPLEEHLVLCVECQSDLNDLMELLSAAYADRQPLGPVGARPSLAFLRPPAPAGRPWHVERSTLVLGAAAPIWQAQPALSLAGAPRGQLLYRYVQDPGSVADLEVSIEVYADSGQPGHARVQVSVEVPSRDPLEQAGCLVVLHAASDRWDGQTDELGSIDFAPVPLHALPQIRIEITPPR